MLRAPRLLLAALSILAGCSASTPALRVDSAPPVRQGELIVLVHGLGSKRAFMLPLATRLEQAGYRVVRWGYASLGGTVEDHAETLRAELASHDGDPTVDRVHLVTHSLGGVVTRAALAAERPRKLGRVVMLAPPHGGSDMADLFRQAEILVPVVGQLTTDAESYVKQLPTLVGVEVGIIAGGRDLMVRREATHLAGEAAHLELPAGHSELLLRSDAAEAVIEFLSAGAFRGGVASAF